MNKKVVVLGGGTGSSALLRGLKQFPIDLTAIVSVCDPRNPYFYDDSYKPSDVPAFTNRIMYIIVSKE